MHPFVNILKTDYESLVEERYKRDLKGGYDRFSPEEHLEFLNTFTQVERFNKLGPNKNLWKEDVVDDYYKARKAQDKGLGGYTLSCVMDFNRVYADKYIRPLCDFIAMPYYTMPVELYFKHLNHNTDLIIKVLEESLDVDITNVLEVHGHGGVAQVVLALLYELYPNLPDDKKILADFEELVSYFNIIPPYWDVRFGDRLWMLKQLTEEVLGDTTRLDFILPDGVIRLLEDSSLLFHYNSWLKPSTLPEYDLIRMIEDLKQTI